MTRSLAAGLLARPRAPSPSSRITPIDPRTPKLLPPVLQLQRTMGNRRLAQLIQRKRVTPQGKIIGIQRTVATVNNQRESEAARVERQNTGHLASPGAEGAGLQRVHMDPAGRKVFDCPDFAGDKKLEACLNDKDRLRPSEHGPTVAKVQKALLRDGADLGRRGADGDYGPATARAVMAFKKKYNLGFEQFPDVGPGTMAKLDELCLPGPQPSCPPCPQDPRTAGCPACPPAKPCPPCPENPRTAECPPCAEPSSHICGPNIDSQLTKVLGEMQTHFRALGGWSKHWSCQWLITPPMAIMAWDIHNLFLPETGWLRATPFSPPCGLPPAPISGGVEDPATCSNSVQVGGKCNLAGTANYATFGIMMKECHSYYSGSPTLPTWKANIPFFTETAMKSLIGLYKTATFDDKGPPTEFAEATFRSGPSGRPGTENRKHCSIACSAPAPPPAFTFVWEPSKSR